MGTIFRISSLSLVTTLMINSIGISSAVGSVPDRATSVYAKLPLSFEVNRGQTDPSVKFLARGKGYNLYLSRSEAVFSLSTPASARIQGINVVRMKLQGANADPVIKGLNVLPGKSRYFMGADQRASHTNIDRYEKVELKQVYPGIDMVYYGNRGELEYDFVVAPGADPGLIRLDFRGAKSVEVDKQGNLVLQLKDSQLAFHAPVLTQKIGSVKELVQGRYVLAGKRQVRFEVRGYDRSKELVIDPLMYSTYLGGTVEDRANAIVLDKAGNVYVAGLTVSGSFPGSASGFQPAIAAGTDVFVTKISAAGVILWSTYLGGNGIDIANSIAVDGFGRVHIAGSTTSSDFPTASPYQAALAGGTDGFVASINPGGTALIYSTYLGGAGVDACRGIVVDNAGNAYVTGGTTSDATTFPQTSGVYQTAAGGAEDAFVSKFTAAGGISYSTFLGGTGGDQGRAIAIDGVGNAYVAGQAADAFPIFPVTVFKTTITGAFDAFVAKLNPTGTSLLYSTYVGGSDIDDAFGIALDGANPTTLNIYITGYTESANFPNIGFSTVGQTTRGTSPDAYVFKLNMNGGGGLLDGVYSTYLGASGDDRGTAIKVDSGGNAYVTGHTTSADFALVNPVDPVNTGTGMVFVTEISPTGATKIFSTYLGGVTDQAGNGIAMDSSNNIYATGWTDSTDFDTASPIQAANAGSFDAFVTKFTAASPEFSGFTGVIIGGDSGVNSAGGCDPHIFPSPARGSLATVAYCMDQAGHIKIRVYNEIGVLADTLEEDKSAGPQNSTISVGKMAPGVYFFLLTLSYDGGSTIKHAKRKFVVSR